MAAEDKTYLELSQEGDGSHKFYEVTVAGKQVTIRFGRIGDAGQTSTKSYASPAKAKEEAATKIQEKQRKGYEAAVAGGRQKRAVARRSVSSQKSTAKQAPVLWKFSSGTTALGIFIDDRGCWIGNEAGKVFGLDHDGKVVRQFELPDAVMALVGDDVWMYAGCDDGNVYDLNGRAPRLSYEVAADSAIDWIDIWDGILAVSTQDGSVTTIDPENKSLWTRKGPGGGGFTVRIDPKGVYHGHGDSVTTYNLRGKQLWRKKTGYVLFGWQTETGMYVGTTSNNVRCLAKKGGKPLATYACDAVILSCATAPGGKYVFAGDGCSSVYCFDAKGKRLWKLGTGCGSALSMQFHDDKVYIVTTDGDLACLDAGEGAIQKAEAGTVPKARQIKAPAKGKATTRETKVETTSDAKQGVMVECLQEGKKLRMSVISPGYQKKWFVQFPRDIREAGARYVVDEVRESARGGFYRAYGEIKKLVTVATGRKKR